MKAPSVRDFSVFSYLSNLGPLQLRNLHIRLLTENFDKKKTVSLTKPVYNMLLH